MATLSFFAPTSVAGSYGIPNAFRDLFVPGVVLLAGIFLPSTWLIGAFVVLGQGHFLMSYIYQYRGGKMTRRYIVLAGLLLLSTLAYLVVLGEQGLWMFLLVSLLFPIHFAFDEFVLHSERLTVRGVTTIFGFTLLAFVIVLSAAFPIVVTSYFLYGLIALFFCGAGVRILLSRSSILRSEYYLWGIGLVVTALFFIGRPEQALSVIILLHGLNWLIGFGKRVEGWAEKEKRDDYWRLTILTHGAGLVAFIIFLSFHFEPLRYFFLIVYYDAWAIAHITLSASARFARK